MNPMDEKLLAILNDEFGHRTSREHQSCLDKDERPIPWYTYPAIEYLNDIDISSKSVFEYGCGNSSLYWAARTNSVISVEEDPTWFKKISDQCLENQKILLRENKGAYVNEIVEHGTFDIIVIDGHSRRDCALLAHEKLNTGGLIVLDNSDWYVGAAAQLRNYDYIQVDMKGFGPINPYCWATSFFFSRDFNFKPRVPHQPSHGHGARCLYAEEEK